MTTAAAEKPAVALSGDLAGKTARDLMSPDPVFMRSGATDEEAIRLFTDRGVSAVVVIDDAGRPLGVLTATDVLIHQREKLARSGAGEPVMARDMMTPAVFSVRVDTPARQVIEQMVALNVHRLFVVDDGDLVVGVMSALGVLRGMVS
jgi:CBS domain-containing protein